MPRKQSFKFTSILNSKPDNEMLHTFILTKRMHSIITQKLHEELRRAQCDRPIAVGQKIVSRRAVQRGMHHMRLDGILYYHPSCVEELYMK